MTFRKSDALVRFRRPTNSRIALALAHARSDSKNRPQVGPFGSSKNRAADDPSYWVTLLQQTGCQDAWDAYTDTTTATAFPQQLAQGTAPLNGFRHYTIQDAIYLEYYVRVRMEAIGTWDSKVSTQDLWAFVNEIPDGLNYSASTVSVCEDQLGVPASDVESEWSNPSQELETSIRFYESVIANAINQEISSWIDIYFALLPCIKGYYTIGKALLQDTTTIRNTLYYSLWIQPNADPSYAAEYDAFLEENTQGATDEQWAHWGAIFKQTCNNEQNFFNLAISDYPEYAIVSPAAYTISPYVNNAKYLGTDSQGNVGVFDTSVNWQLTNNADGYSIQLGDQQYLGVDDQQQVVIKSDDSTKWSINPVVIPEKSTYQLFLAGAIQLALDVDNGLTTVSVQNNNATTQTWILTAAS